MEHSKSKLVMDSAALMQMTTSSLAMSLESLRDTVECALDGNLDLECLVDDFNGLAQIVCTLQQLQADDDNETPLEPNSIYGF